jgi:hypothetical protein
LGADCAGIGVVEGAASSSPPQHEAERVSVTAGHGQKSHRVGVPVVFRRTLEGQEGMPPGGVPAEAELVLFGVVVDRARVAQVARIGHPGGDGEVKVWQAPVWRERYDGEVSAARRPGRPVAGEGAGCGNAEIPDQFTAERECKAATGVRSVCFGSPSLWGSCCQTAPSGFPRAPRVAGFLALVLVLIGLFIRWTAILTLGRFFTVDVAVHSDHALVENGLYRFVRHPFYTGLLVAFLGVGGSLCQLDQPAGAPGSDHARCPQAGLEGRACAGRDVGVGV